MGPKGKLVSPAPPQSCRKLNFALLGPFILTNSKKLEILFILFYFLNSCHPPPHLEDS